MPTRILTCIQVLFADILHFFLNGTAADHHVIHAVVQTVKNTSIESVVSVSGIVRKRPENMVNSAMETGTVEVFLDTYRLLSKAEHLPFQTLNAEENIRLKYRYLDLRRP